MSNKASHRETWEKIKARAALDHDHADELKHKNYRDDNDRYTTLSKRENHDHDEALKIKMHHIQNFVNKDPQCVFALKHYQGLEKGVLVNACKGLGISAVRAVLERVSRKPPEWFRKSRGEYLTGALKMEVRNKGLEWGEWDIRLS